MNNPRNSAHAVSSKEADQVRAARGFESFAAWKRENRKAAKSHRAAGKHELADTLDREYDRYIARNL